MPKLDSAKANTEALLGYEPRKLQGSTVSCDWRRAGIFCNHSKEGARNAASMLDNMVDR